MNKNDSTDYFDALNPADCPTTGCAGLTGRFVSTYPVITRIFKTGLNKGDEKITLNPTFTANITVQGYNFFNTKKVFLSASDQSALSSGHNITNPLTSVDLFSSYPGISSTFTPFSAYEVTAFTVVDKNHIMLDLPILNQFDLDLYVIIVNTLGHSVPFTEQIGRHPSTSTS
jgi:hypothetical protein